MIRKKHLQDLKDHNRKLTKMCNALVKQVSKQDKTINILRNSIHCESKDKCSRGKDCCKEHKRNKL